MSTTVAQEQFSNMADGPDDAARTDWGQHHIRPSEDDGEEDGGGGGGRPPRRFLVYPGTS